MMPGADGPKYRNIPETPLYDKSKVLYGLTGPRTTLVKADEVIVCEGYTDVIGFARAACPGRWPPAARRSPRTTSGCCKRFAQTIVLAFDPDAAGQAAAERFYEWEQKHEIEVAVADLPPGEDPGDLARSDPDRLRAAVAGACRSSASGSSGCSPPARLDTPEGRARTAEAALAVIAEHPTSSCATST